MDAELEQLKKEIIKFAVRTKGKTYAPIPHPYFEDIPSYQGRDRWDIIKRELPKLKGTVLDIGSNWGYFSHKFEDEGFKVYSVEYDPKDLYFLKKIKKVCNKNFKVIEKSIFSFFHKQNSFDVVLALNIFHHFIKTKEKHEMLINLLNNLKMKFMFFESHNTAEPQMEGAYKNYSPEEFIKFIITNSCLNTSKIIGEEKDKGRIIFRLDV